MQATGHRVDSVSGAQGKVPGHPTPCPSGPNYWSLGSVVVINSDLFPKMAPWVDLS